MSRLPRKERVYLSADKIIDDDENENEDFPAEVHNTLSVSGLPDHELKLKEGSLSLLETPRLSTFRLKEWNVVDCIENDGQAKLQ